MDEVEAVEVEGAPETAAARIRHLVPEAKERGSSTVSANAMQARLFDIYDEVSDRPEVLTLVQSQLTLPLERTLFTAEQVDALADSIDWHLGPATPDGSEPELVGGA